MCWQNRRTARVSAVHSPAVAGLAASALTDLGVGMPGRGDDLPAWPGPLLSADGPLTAFAME